ncbi:uncharacterized protein [Physcomitrium patens]|uniref:Uncharacterized protein n=1 Tax=Physcomitrium patens TaxID=3218 RepID=A0A7I4FUQ8_PHYPA|nr:calphotin-like isoform X1 [Physcomitrium patens]XP_024382157.1 calphotin-like isoform X1 [Physcomitrium patens]XP_024382158.1 calphotin-like isoform X1 [Physcomitrium patens]XP_024382159.1 calphotin-like isoform X1 [Physcomitrium patens]XP_024382160.1 calphotin-like isoform X1 [Physcomitrium patens]XP_024382162.1 calphotin-like isoform X1 [Physcomitrium patens]XP_024382163.1 calphotin-like isoform X1 [Physcomitrium patens]|eukprot:XP_024382156.1 calphotin-like isoform X1 [Physcomitrella patens]
MAGHVQEAVPQPLAVKRGAEAELEPAPVAKRPAEDPERNQHAKLTDVTPNATQREEENKIEASPAALSENGKPSAEHQHGSGEVGNGSNAEDLQAGAHLEAQNGEEDAAGNGPSSAAVTSQSATKAAAAQEKQLKCEEALPTPVDGAPVHKNTIKPVIAEASETASAAKSAGDNMLSVEQAADTAPQAPALSAEEITEAATVEKPEDARTASEALPALATPLPAAVSPPPKATPSLTPVAGLAGEAVCLPPLPHSALAESIVSISPQAMGNSKSACVLPPQSTPEPLEQRDPDRTTPLVLSVGPIAAPME